MSHSANGGIACDSGAVSTIVMLSHYSAESLHVGHVTPNGAFGLVSSLHYPMLHHGTPCHLVVHKMQSTMMAAEAV